MTNQERGKVLKILFLIAIPLWIGGFICDWSFHQYLPSSFDSPFDLSMNLAVLYFSGVLWGIVTGIATLILFYGTVAYAMNGSSNERI